MHKALTALLASAPSAPPARRNAHIQWMGFCKTSQMLDSTVVGQQAIGPLSSTAECQESRASNPVAGFAVLQGTLQAALGFRLRGAGHLALP